LAKSGHRRFRCAGEPAGEKADHRHRLLRACRERPSRRRAAEKADELAPPHGLILKPLTTPYHIR
jgi:hypothetical protein